MFSTTWVIINGVVSEETEFFPGKRCDTEFANTTNNMGLKGDPKGLKGATGLKEFFIKIIDTPEHAF